MQVQVQVQMKLQIQLQIQLQIAPKMNLLIFIARISSFPRWNLHQTGLDSHSLTGPDSNPDPGPDAGPDPDPHPAQMSSKMGYLNFITRISSFPRWNLHQTCLDSHCPSFKSRSRSRSRSRRKLTSLDKLFNWNLITMYDPGHACHLYIYIYPCDTNI